MTRRERHLRIIASWDQDTIRFHLESLLARQSFGALKDEAVENLARRLIAAKNYTKKLNEQNRKLRETRVA